MSEAIAFAAGVVLGVLIAALTYERTFRLVARFSATGTLPATTTTVEDKDPRLTGSAEANAAATILSDAIERGANDIAEAYKQAGTHISRAQAIREAKQLFDNAHPLGGAL